MSETIEVINWMDACIYARKSTHKYAQRESVENQISICKGEAPRFNLRIVETKKDTATGTDDLNRPEVKEMIEDAVNGKFKCIIMKGISRFFRDVEKGLTLIKMLDRHGIRMVTIEEGFDSAKDRTSTGKLDTSKITMYLMFAEMESKKTGDRVKYTQIDKARRGEWNSASNTPYGYKFNSETKKLEIDYAGSQVIKLIFDLYLQGMGMRSIQHYLNGENDGGTVYPSPKGAEWSQYTIGFIIRNPAYVGDLVYNRRSKKERTYKQPELFGKTKDDIWIGNDHNDKSEWIVTKNAHEAIVSREDFEQAQLIVNTKALRKGIRSNVGLLAGIAKCTECGSGMTFKRGNKDPETGWIKTKSNYYCMNYIKYGKRNCTSHHIGSDDLENSVINNLKSLRMNEGLIDRIFEKKRSDMPDENDKLKKEKAKIEKEIKLLADKLDKLLEKNLSGKISDDQFDSMNQRYKTDLASCTNRVEKINESFQTDTIAESREVDFRKMIEKVSEIDNLNKDQKRLLIMQLVDRVEITADLTVNIYYKFSNPEINLH